MPRIVAGWLVLDQRDIVDITVSMSTIVEVMKHWDDSRRRSFLCSGSEDCSFCVAGIPQRQRWQCMVFLDGQSLSWEFGAQVHTLLFKLPGHQGDFMPVRISCLGQGRMSKYFVSLQPSVNPYKLGKYGHVVQT